LHLASEECDDGNADNDDECLRTCEQNRCGDGFVDPLNEECDDGNASNNDGCIAGCIRARCGDGLVDALTEECDDGNAADSDACRNDCRRNVCGDGVLRAGVEQCDDGNRQSGDGCRGDCQKIEVCGDRVVDAGEQCDDGNLNPVDGCGGCKISHWSAKTIISGDALVGTNLAFRFDASCGSCASSSTIAVDPVGRVFFSDNMRSTIWRLDRQGILMPVVGHGLVTGQGQGILEEPRGIAIGPQAEFVTANTERNNVVVFSSVGELVSSTFTGGIFPSILALDRFGNTIIVDGFCNVIRSPDSSIFLAGALDCTLGVSPDGAQAVGAKLQNIKSITFDFSNRLIFSDDGGIRRVGSDGRLETLGPPAVELDIDSDENLIFSDGNSIKRMAATNSGPITTIFSSPTSSPAITSFSISNDGTVFLVQGNEIRRVLNPSSSVRIAGGGSDEDFLAGGTTYEPFSYLEPPIQAVSITGFGQLFSGHTLQAIQTSSNLVTTSISQPGSGVIFNNSSSIVLVNNITIKSIDIDKAKDGAVDPMSSWVPVENFITTPSGPLAFDTSTDTLLLASTSEHCVRRLQLDGARIGIVAGRCGSPGSLPGFLFAPEGIAVSDSGVVYVADTGNHRVFRVAGGQSTLVIGDGSKSSAGEGAPARLFPVDSPHQLQVDRFGNLFVTSTTTVRVVADTNDSGNADGGDTVLTIYGKGDRSLFPESDSLCLTTLALAEDDSVFVADACRGFVVQLSQGVSP
jgi:cysteine-rich repeat protein